jgi:hypothetical protein
MILAYRHGRTSRVRRMHTKDMDKTQITIERVQAGQPRPYADSVYEYILIFTAERGIFEPFPDFVQNIAKVVSGCYEVQDFGKPTTRFGQPYVSELEKLGTGKWRVKIIEPFVD